MKAKTSRPPKTLSGPTNMLLKPARAAADPELRQRIALKAFEIYQQRGGMDGHDREDWLEAERLVLSEIESPFNPALAPRDIV